jgi:hypothetical protein
VHKAEYFVSGCETRNQPFLVFPHSPLKVVGHACVEVAGTAGQDVRPVASVHLPCRSWKHSWGSGEREKKGKSKEGKSKEGKSRSLTRIRKRRGWVRDDNVRAKAKRKSKEKRRAKAKSKSEEQKRRAKAKSKS